MASDPNSIENYARAAAFAIGLNIPAEFEKSVIGNLERMLELTSALRDFPLDEDIELAPVFQP